MFVNSVLCNVDVWYGLTSLETETFDKLDYILLRKILGAPRSSPIEAFYLELGIIPLSILLKQKRINYLYYLLSRDKSEMLSRFFWTQWENPVKNDWTEIVRQDLADFGMSADPEYLKKYSNFTFKKQVKNKAKEFAFDKLMELKNAHSKMNSISYSELKLQSYFSLPETNITEIRKVFLFRTRMANFSENFRNRSDVSRLCPLCDLHLDNQIMIAQCKVISDQFKGSVQQILKNIYSQSIVKNSVKELVKVLEYREKIMKEKEKE